MPELLKISELAAKAGVSKSTVQHYVREGLLPPPEKKPHRNMAYYRSDMVDQIKLIKELQTRQHLPLVTIKELLKDARSVAEIRALLYNQPLTLQALGEEPIGRRRLIADSGLGSEELDRLAELGLVTPRRRGKSEIYEPNDAAIVHAVASMRRAGLDPAHGFRAEHLVMYLDAMRDLIQKEIALFSKVLNTASRKELLNLARVGLGGTGGLLIALRRKVFLDLLTGRGGEAR